jgi:N6-L-threonylcarbamoyladenine synthase
MAIYLGIETSCDETAAAVVADGRHILSNCLISQMELHKNYGGIVPEIAAREHLESINSVIELAMQQAQLKPADLDGIACTVGPGLIGTLLVGLSAAKALSFAWDLPLIAVDHLIAHVCANYLESGGIEEDTGENMGSRLSPYSDGGRMGSAPTQASSVLTPPFLALLVSGGHTQLMYFNDFAQAQTIGQTIDDAAGEAYDKVARLLGLGYPGGPAIDHLASTGDKTKFPFPRASVDGFNFSFSGLKTAVLRCLQKMEQPWPIADLAASFQQAVVDSLIDKTLRAQKKTQSPVIVLAGGVAANSSLRQQLLALSPVPVVLPKIALCTDNAAMIAAAGYFSQVTGAEHGRMRVQNAGGWDPPLHTVSAPLAAYSRSKSGREIVESL